MIVLFLPYGDVKPAYVVSCMFNKSSQHLITCFIVCHFYLTNHFCLFNSVMTPSNIVTYMNGVEKLGGGGLTSLSGRVSC
jgi:hypothetical protein